MNIVSSLLTVPLVGSRSNSLLVIGTPEYNKVRYPGDRHGGVPTWKTDMEYVLNMKAQGKHRYSRKANGTVFNHVAKRMRQEIIGCIYNNLHFKSKTFEYKPLDYSFHVKGKYVARLDENQGALGSFTLRRTNDKYSRYRLKELGLRLVAKGNRTFWKIDLESKYFEYLMLLYGSFENMANQFKDIFPSMKHQRTKRSDNNPDYWSPWFVEVTCELRDDIEYPIHPARRGHQTHGTQGAYTYSSGIFHALFKRDDSEDFQGTYSEIERVMPLFAEQFEYLYDARSTPEGRKELFVELMKASLEDPKFILGLCVESSIRSHRWSIRYGEIQVGIGRNGIRLYCTDTMKCDEFIDSSLVTIEKYLSGESYLRFKAKCSHDMSLLHNYVLNKSRSGYNRVFTRSVAGLIEINFRDEFFSEEEVWNNLIGKELWIG